MSSREHRLNEREKETTKEGQWQKGNSQTASARPGTVRERWKMDGDAYGSSWAGNEEERGSGHRGDAQGLPRSREDAAGS